MAPNSSSHLIQRLIAFVRTRVPFYVWIFSAIIILAVIVGTSGALQLKRGQKIPSKPLPPKAGLIKKAEPIAKPVKVPAAEAVPVIESKPILPEKDTAVAEPVKPYEEALPEKVYEPQPTDVKPLVAHLPKTEPVVVTPGRENTWRKNAVQLADLPPGPKIAIVIDDAGVDRKRTAAAIALPAPVTIAFLTYANGLAKQVKAAKAAGHEVMVHMAMEPLNQSIDPGPNVLLSSSDKAEILKRLRWGLDRFDGYVGINNHMGSKFTSDPIGMNVMMQELKRRGLLFLDSRTTGSTVGASIALANDVPFTQRNIFLDNVPTVDAINKQLRRLEIFAKRNGYAVAIGHPRDATIQALSQWLAVLVKKGFVAVPVSTIVAKQLH